MKRQLLATLSAIAVLGLAVDAPAHGPVERKAEGQERAARLFTSDSATGEVVAVDLPVGNVVARIETPPHVLILGLSGDSRYVFAMRGRDTDRDMVTVIDTSFDVATGQASYPFVARSFIGSAPGGVREGHLATVGGSDAIFMEDAAELQVYGSRDFGGLSAVPVRTYKLAGRDHYHYLESGSKLYVGHLRASLVQIIDRENGREVGRVEGCPILHGMAKDDATGRLFFACQTDVLVIGSRGKEEGREVTRIPYPGKQRVGYFLRGKDRIWWGKTEGAIPMLHRLDVAKQPYAFQSIEVDSSIQQKTTADGSLLLVYSRSGVMDIRDGGTGELLHKVTLSKPFDSAYHEHVDKALLPDIEPIGNLAYVTIPTEGVIVEVDLPKGEVLRRLEVGGEPTRLLAVRADPPATPQAAR